MAERYTCLDLIEDVLTKTQMAMSPKEIYEKAQELGLVKKAGMNGNAPAHTIYARVYYDIMDHGTSSKFEQVSKRPSKFALRGAKLINVDAQNVDAQAAQPAAPFKERDLHPLLVKFVDADPHFKCHTKTIYHEHSKKKVKGATEWLHPDLVGVYFPFGDTFGYMEATTNLQKSLEVSSVKLFSFEMKIELNYSNLRQYFFQAVSNSSWANEGYLVCLKIDEDSDFINELQRLSNAFGIGIIKLDAEHIAESEIICPARFKEDIDWDTLDELVDVSPDFEQLVSDITNSVKIHKADAGSEYDKILDDDTYENYIRDKKIVQSS